jgi:cytochrome c
MTRLTNPTTMLINAAIYASPCMTDADARDLAERMDRHARRHDADQQSSLPTVWQRLGAAEGRLDHVAAGL